MFSKTNRESPSPPTGLHGHDTDSNSNVSVPKKRQNSTCNNKIKTQFVDGRKTRSMKTGDCYAFPHNTCEILSHNPQIPSLDKFLTIGNGLTVGNSGIVGAGLGLFATRTIQAGTIFTWYQGKLVDASIGHARDKLLKSTADETSHLCSIDANYVIDGIRSPVRGAGGGSFNNHFKYPNADYIRCPECHGVFLVAKKNIPKGQEIVTNYEKQTLFRQLIPFRSKYDIKIAGSTDKIAGNFICSVCDDALSEDISEFHKHVSKHMEKKGFNCELCGILLKNKKSLNVHMSIHTGEKKLQCNVCSRSFIQKGNLTRHHLTVHAKKDDKKFNCTKCKSLFKTEQSKDIHLRTQHTTNKSIQCLQCQETFSKEAQYQTHKEEHLNTSLRKCSYCPKMFLSVKQKKDHDKIHSAQKIYRCKFCQKTFTTSNNRSRHQNIHTKDKCYQCEHCEKTFFDSVNRTRHMKSTHEINKPYECKYCAKKFARQDHKKLHERTHTDEKPYKCVICDKTFTNSSDKNKHLLFHSQEKPHKCSYCQKLFSNSSNKIQHERTHTGQKPYKCSFCEKHFSLSSNKNVHERTHTKQNRYQCSTCDTTFSTAGSKKRHQQKKHG